MVKPLDSPFELKGMKESILEKSLVIVNYVKKPLNFIVLENAQIHCVEELSEYEQ